MEPAQSSEHDAIEKALKQVAPGLDEPLIEYLASVAAAEKVVDPKGLYDVLGDLLISYDVAEDEEGCKAVCHKLSQLLSAAGVSVRLDEYEHLKGENEKMREAFQVGTQVSAFYPSDGQWYDGRIVAVLRNGNFRVQYLDYDETIELSLGQVKLFNSVVRLGESADETIRDAKMMTKILLNEVSGDWRPVTADNATILKQKSLKQQKKEEQAKRSADSRDRYFEEQKKVAKEKKKIEVLRTYLASQGEAKSSDINILNFNLSPPGGGMELLESACLRLVTGRRYGLIGRNGIGKTTLLAAIANYEVKGFPTHLRVMHVEQEVVGNERTVMEWVLEADIERALLLREEAELSRSLGREPLDMRNSPPESEQEEEDEEDKEDDATEVTDESVAEGRLLEIYSRLRDIDAWGAEARAISVLNGLQFSSEQRMMQTKDLSGGWRMRVALAAALFVAPDLLLLDEPTNHLDFPAVVWLEDYLCNYKKTLVCVSHDRKFVNNVITDVIHFNNKKLIYFRGDYDTFEKVEREQKKAQKKAYDAQLAKKEHIQKFIDKFRYNAKRASLVQSRIKAVDRMDLLDDVVEDPHFHFEFPEVEVLKKPLVLVSNLKFGYTPQKTLLQNASLRVDMSSRIGVLGGNGIGKSTLIKLLMGDLVPEEGFIELNASARVTCFAQHHVDQMDMRLTPLQQLQKLFSKAKEQEIRAHLGRYGITGDLALQRISTMSGGQQSRVAFAVVTWNKPHLILLDEPTNHLDLETVDALIMAINTFSGGIVVVSHDQHLLSSSCTEFWAISDHKVLAFKEFEDAKKFCYGKLKLK